MIIKKIINKSKCFFSVYRKDKLNLYLSIIPNRIGGGSNTFSYNFIRWGKNQPDVNIVYNIKQADKAIIIANKGDYKKVLQAKQNGCYIIHRLDEHVENNEDALRKHKHEYIKRLNELADITIYQSNFIFENMHPYLECPKKYSIIHNGANKDDFYPAKESGQYIGHITWGVSDKKRLDILFDMIKANPNEDFLLIGNHMHSGHGFDSLSNVKLVGPVKRKHILNYYHQMKFMLFPSENDPCPNTAVEALMSGVPLCYNSLGGTKELVKNCGVPLEQFDVIKADWKKYRTLALQRKDLDFNVVAKKYLSL